MAKALTVLGLMSGTSMDGIDASLLRTDGEAVGEPLAHAFTPYPDEVRAAIRACLGLAHDPDGRVARAEQLVTDWHIKAVRDFPYAGQPPDLIGFHGQTIFHDPANARTWQIGDGQRLASATGCDVIYDFRTNDMRHGGQGAPLIPLYHQALMLKAGMRQPACMLNLGGVGNVTWVDGDRVYACDTGPGNALIDDWMLRRTGLAMDKDGAHALRGTPDLARVDTWLSHPFFALKPPKSLDRNAFANCSVADLSLEDGAATLAAFTIASVRATLAQMPGRTDALIVAGGGRHNLAIMRGLAQFYDVTNADAIGLDGDQIEAQGFAYLAARSYYGLPLSLPTTTGCRAPVTGGRLVKT